MIGVQMEMKMNEDESKINEMGSDQAQMRPEAEG